MEMTAVLEERKSKSPFPLFDTALESSQKPRASHIPTASATTWDFHFLQVRLPSTSTKSVTYLPGTFCYRHARSHKVNKDLGFSPCTFFFAR
jgi:hypothetical protein